MGKCPEETIYNPTIEFKLKFAHPHFNNIPYSSALKTNRAPRLNRNVGQCRYHRQLALQSDVDFLLRIKSTWTNADADAASPRRSDSGAC